MHRLLPFALCFFAIAACAQEQVDKADEPGDASSLLKKLSVRVRVTKAAPEQTHVHLNWRRGGEGLGGNVVRSFFLGTDKEFEIPVGQWSDWHALATIVGQGRGWSFPSVVAEGVSLAAPGKGKAAPPGDPGIDLDAVLDEAQRKEKVARAGDPLGAVLELKGAPKTVAPAKGKAAKAGIPLTETVVEFEFAEGKNVFKHFSEPAPKGATVGFAFPGSMLGDRVTPEFVAQLTGLSTHARARREGLEKLFPQAAKMPVQFAVIGRLGGYGAGEPGRGGGSGYGVRHCNPEILIDECRAMRMLGINGLTGSPRFADAAGLGKEFRRIHWGSGGGNPMAVLQQGSARARKASEGDECPFDPAIQPPIPERIAGTIEDHRAVGAQESWGITVDEIGVFAKEHIARCERCAEKFREYLKAQKLSPADLGKKSWEEVKPINIWAVPAAAGKGAKKAVKSTLPSESPADALCHYYTFRFMTHATAQVFPDSVQGLKAAGILVYAMQGPTPSWMGSSLDWHEFYDGGASSAFVWETSNRDPRVWQWDSYLADIGRGIAARHDMPMGCLVKPHRGAPAQRMLSVVSRGVRAIEWYTYGPDYSKGDSFSQSPELLERVARAARFLGSAEDRLYDAHFAGEPEVAFVTPRSSGIWGRADGLDGTAFENAKWVWLALTHAHIPMNILSEQQLAEGRLERYKVIYIPGTHLRRDAAAKVKDWVRAGGSLWTDAFGLARDEANQPATGLDEVLGLSTRKLETWGHVDGYRAVGLTPLTESEVPPGADLMWEADQVHASIGREALDPGSAEILARFADGKPAVTRNRFGKGDATVVGLWSGITYSAKVRRPDFSMRDDFSPAVRALVAAPALARKVYQPARLSEPLVEAVSLDKGGSRSIALINWAYHRPSAATGKGELQVAKNLRVDLTAVGPVKSVRSLLLGELPVTDGSVILPTLAEIDLLLLD